MRVAPILVLPLVLLAAVPVRAQSLDAEGASQVVARVNAMRRAQGLAELERDPALDEAAAQLSREMAKTGALAHVSETSGTPADRVAAAGVRATALAEHIAHGDSAVLAHESLVASDAHRKRMLDPNMTHIGVAVAVNAHGAWMTELLAREETQEQAPQEDAQPPEPAPPAPVEEPPPAYEAGEGELDAQAEPEPPAEAGRAAEGDVVQLAEGGGGRVEVHVPRGAPAQVVVVRKPEGQRIVGYWVESDGRWWYYPRPANVAPGTELSPDPSVQGPPPGYAPEQEAAPPPPPPSAAVRPAPRHRVIVVLPHRPRPPFGWSPRRHYWRWRYSR